MARLPAGHDVGEVDRETVVEIARQQRLAGADIGLEHATEVLLVIGRGDRIVGDEALGNASLRQHLLAHHRAFGQVLGGHQHGDLLAVAAGIFFQQRRLLGLEVYEGHQCGGEAETDGTDYQGNAKGTPGLTRFRHERSSPTYVCSYSCIRSSLRRDPRRVVRTDDPHPCPFPRTVKTAISRRWPSP
ncbi:MAG: hypothetical protein IPG43_22560 [Proteobacteria bacterium]|nr:hypothetical protein [Pseudomonadota bacterium]